MRIVFASSECVPWAKTGGLADVVGALPGALAKLGHEVSVFLPYYRQVARTAGSGRVRLESVTIPFPSYNRFVRLLDAGVREGVQYYFVDCPEMFDREGFYGEGGSDYPDNAERFGLFSRAVIECCKVIGVPDIFHVHDWQTTMISVLMRSVYFFDPVLRGVPTVLTIHNAGYQGWFAPRTMELLLLPWDMFTFDKLEQDDTLNFLKGGIVYADAITTVSRKYAEEIQTAEFGAGLDGLLRRRSGDVFGILNGVDYSEWDPATDKYLAANFSAEDLSGKRACRADLLREFGLEGVGESTPVLGVVSRFAGQKGFDFLAQIFNELMQEEVALVVLGTGEEQYERLFARAAEVFPGRVGVMLKYDNAMAHKVEAGSDMFLMPSRYEPCGLNQIYSLKYGTVPVVRATGGLDDTIDEQHMGGGTGFKFHGYSAWAFLDAIKRALAVFQHKDQWEGMMRRGMAMDYGWEGPAREYVQVYERAIRSRN